MEVTRSNLTIAEYYETTGAVIPLFPVLQEMLKMAKDIGIPLSNLHRLADGRFSHVNFVFNKGRMDFVQHTIDFFQGGNATWTGGEPDFEPGDAY